MEIDQSTSVENIEIESRSLNSDQNNRPSRKSLKGALLFVLAFALGIGSGYLIWGRNSVYPVQEQQEVQSNTGTGQDLEAGPTLKISLPQSYALPVSFGDIGPRLIESGAIDYERFVQVYEKARQPLTEAQQAVLKGSANDPIVINRENAYFLLNFFWAFGLTNKNPVLLEGPMMQAGADQVGRFASTGGWTIGMKPATELYASTEMVALTPDQQARLERVAQEVYRPCCNNPTHFPDCNHGMAMLGMLELMASQGASEEAMFEAAKYFNAFWYPQQSYELAIYMKLDQGVDFAGINSEQAVSNQFFSGSGFQSVHQILAANGVLRQGPGNGNGCGV